MRLKEQALALAHGPPGSGPPNQRVSRALWPRLSGLWLRCSGELRRSAAALPRRVDPLIGLAWHVPMPCKRRAHAARLANRGVAALVRVRVKPWLGLGFTLVRVRVHPG